MEFVRGMRSRLTGVSSGEPVDISVCARTEDGTGVDVCCFGLDPSGVLQDDRYFLFYNQPESPCGAVRIVSPSPPGGQCFRAELDRLPSNVRRLCITASIDGAGTMASLGPGYVRLSTAVGEIARFAFHGHDFALEKSVILAEIYEHADSWRLWAVGQGFAGGLDSLLAHYGGTTTDSPPDIVAVVDPAPAALPDAPPVAQPAPPKPEGHHRVEVPVIAEVEAERVLGGPSVFWITTRHRPGSVRVRIDGESVAASAVRVLAEVGGGQGVAYALAGVGTSGAAVVRADYEPVE